MSLSATTIETVLVHPPAGCGTIDSPWRGWERQVEASAFGPPRSFQFRAGFWAADRPVRLGSGVTIGAASPDEGRPWFLPVDDLETLFRIDGVHEARLLGVCLVGRGGRARHGVLLRAGTRLEIRGCRFDDFSGRHGAAVLVSGESVPRYVRGVVIEGSTFLHGTVAIRLERDVSDLLITGNRFEEFSGPALAVDPNAARTDYGLVFVRNTIRSMTIARETPLVQIAPGAEGLRLAENVFECGAVDVATADDAPAAIEMCGANGADSASPRRLEAMLNTFSALAGPAIEGRRCGPGLLASGNVVRGAGTRRRAVIDLQACDGAVAEDNEIHFPRGAGLRLADCRRARAHGNEIRCENPETNGDDRPAREALPGLIVEGEDGRRIRVSDNRISGAAGAGVLATGGRGLRFVGNEMRECGEGLRVRAGRAVVVVGNDCRDNEGCGIRIDEPVRRGFVALNHAILNGASDLAVHGRSVRRRANKVDREA